MEIENLDFDSIMEDRRKMVEQSVRQISIEELKVLGENLFKERIGHPWSDALQRFAAENTGSTFFQANANEQVQLVYCLEKEKGMWFIPGGAMGLMQERGLKVMKIICEARKF